MLQLLIYGIIWGSILMLGGVGLSLTYGIMGFANFAHGDVMALGAYFSFIIATFVRRIGIPSSSFGPLSFGLPILIALIGSMILTAITTILIDRALFKRLRKVKSIILLIAAVGVSFSLRNTIQFIWGPQPKYYFEGIQITNKIPGIAARIKPDEIFIVATAFLLAILVHGLLKYTKVGKAMRATSDNPDLASTVGINTERIITWTWGIGGALAAAGGTLAGIENRFVTPAMGWNMLLPMFAAVILGGIGSPYGAMVGGLVIGLSEELSTAVLPTAYKPAVAFTIMILILLFQPKGLFGGE
ncbi:MAG: branched-chain amino acid ABC transporter permease [Candidatus Bipolaricaulia bacterium]